MKKMIKFLGFLLVLTQFHFINVASTNPNDDKQSIKIIRRVTYIVAQNYYDESRIKPREMLEKGLYELAQEVPEVLPTFDGDKLHFKVGADVIDVSLSGVKHVYDLLDPLTQVFAFLENNYHGDKTLDEMQYAFADGFLEPLDPHSRFFPPVENEQFQTETDGKYGGLGLVVGYEDEKLSVISPVEDTPADRAGIRAGDEILQIDDYSTVNIDLNEAVDLMRGEAGTRVTLKIATQDGTVRSIPLTREIIAIQSVRGKVINVDGQNIGVLRVKSFQGNTMEEFYTEMAKIQKQNPKGLILDLRKNPGGLLQTAVKISDRFLSQGDIVSTTYAGQSEVESAHTQATDIVLPMVVLIDQGSASASEIVAGALKNNNRALVLGRTSFGKGSVQQVYDIPGGSSLKITVAEYLTPGNRSIQTIGIVPDIYVYPSSITDKGFDLKENVYYSEEKLEAHFENKNAKKLDVPFFRLTYLKPETSEKDQKNDSDYIIKIKEAEDYELQLAGKILAATPSAQKSEMIKAAGSILNAEVATQDGVLSEALQKRNINWGTAATTAPASAALTMSYQFLDAEKKPVEVLQAGVTYDFAVTLKNESTQPLTRVLGSVDSLNPLINNKEFVFGAINAGETKTQTIALEVPDEINNFEEKSKLQVFVGGNDAKPQDFAVLTHFREKTSPNLAYSYKLYDGNGADSIGNKNGIPEVGEKIALVATIQNLGPTAAEETLVSIRNESKNAIFMNKARENLAEIKAGEQKSVTFSFDVKAKPEKSFFEFDFYAVDNKTQASLVDKIDLSTTSAKQSKPLADAVQKMPKIVLSEQSGRNKNIYNLVGQVSAETPLKDVAVFVDGKKIYYEDLDAGKPLQSKDLNVALPLNEGLNSIIIKARGARDIPAVKSLSIVYDSQEKVAGR